MEIIIYNTVQAVIRNCSRDYGVCVCSRDAGGSLLDTNNSEKYTVRVWHDNYLIKVLPFPFVSQ